MFSSIQEQTSSLFSYQLQAEFLCSQATRVGVIGSAVSLAVSAFFGYDCLYPATITGFCFCAWIGTELSQATQQEVLNQEFKNKILSFLPERVRQYLNPSPSWVEFMRWPPISRTLPPDSIWVALKDIFSPREEVEEVIEVRAFTNGTNLKYETFNLCTKAKDSGEIQLDHPLEEMIKLLKECFVALNEDGSPAFSPSYHTLSLTEPRYKSLPEETVKVCLLLRKNDLIWNIYDKKTGKVISTQENSLSYRCSEDTRTFFENAKRGSLEDRIRAIRECVLHKCNSNVIYLEPTHQNSGFNEDVLISKFMWTVVLIRYKGISGNHAEIIIEGINDGFFPEKTVPIGKYFVYLADLIGEKEIEKAELKRKVRAIRTDLKAKFNLKYEARSKIWKRSSTRIKSMIKEIEQERDDPPSGFALYGRHSIFASKERVEDSCITWAISQLSKIDIHLEKTKYAFLFTNTSLYTHFEPYQSDPQRDTFLFFWADESKLI